VKDEFHDKVKESLDEVIRADYLPPGTASKLYGQVGFLNEGTFGKVGRAGLQRLNERQHERGITAIDSDLRSSLELILAVMKLRPKRTVWCVNRGGNRFVGASDAAQENPGRGSGGFLVHFCPGSRLGAVVRCKPSMVLWSSSEKQIAQLEMLQVIMALLCFPTEFKGKSGVWYIDNTASLFALCKGRSLSSDLDKMAAMVHGLLFAYQCTMYFEWVESEANWTDSISRLGHGNKFHRQNGFRVHDAEVPLLLWKLPWTAFLAVAGFL